MWIHIISFKIRYLIILLFIIAACSKAKGFNKGSLTIFHNNNSYEFTLEIAETKAQPNLGLMHRKDMAESHAMLFIFPIKRKASMWIKNTFIPLDMLFINSQRIILEIVENTTPLSEKSIISHEKVAMVVELKGGVVQKLNIVKGDTISWHKL